MNTTECCLLGTSIVDADSTVYRTEPYVGRAIEESGAQRENLYITTKYGGIGTPRWAITQSLKNVSSVQRI